MDSGLFNISLSDSEEEDQTSSNNNKGNDTNGTNTGSSRSDRTALSQADFDALKKTYRPKMENGEIFKTITLSLGESIAKPDIQELLHAVEELYFFRRYDEAVRFLHDVLGGDEDDKASCLDNDTKTQLRYYKAKCVQKSGKANASVTASR
ncbi:hypothetical protein B0T17DRAFT_517407 [Bombardia bombarda]|uniref:Uncharacterized protein n=1 Tax=Bombardia bombarda TaxID=252184 RepID=A0AA40CEI7_9PEZI|nr:hypothetical protein B0T17DRAFT_517407 [Bombardia bombarda]